MAKRTLGQVPPQRWRFPERLVGQGTKLLTQQCWYWGCDVRRTEGNLLLGHGFVRNRPPEGQAGSSCYTLEPRPGAQLILWSFGVCFGRTTIGALFLDRFRFEPLLLEPPALSPPVWEREALPPMRQLGPDDCELLAPLLVELLAWIVAYERALEASFGLAYREACLAQWSRQRLALPAAAFSPAWETLAHDCEHALASTVQDERTLEHR